MLKSWKGKNILNPDNALEVALDGCEDIGKRIFAGIVVFIYGAIGAVIFYVGTVSIFIFGECIR